MRKIAPVFIAASIFAVSSTAFALGDKRDKQAAPNTASTSSVPASSGGASALPKSGTNASDATTSGASMGANSASGTSMNGSTAPDKTSGKAKTAAASNDPAKCDVTRYATRSEMPKDCLDGSAGGAAVGSTQGQSGGAGSSGGAGGAGSSGGAGSGGSSK